MSADTRRRCRVAVLGGGLAGLRAALELERRGFAVTVLEARGEVGGRARGRWVDGHWMDSSWPVLGGDDAVLARFARTLDFADSLLPLRPVQTALMRDGTWRPVDGLDLRSVLRIPGPRVWERPKLLRWGRLMRRYAPLLDAVRPERAAELDFRSVADHVSLYFGRGHLEFWLAPELLGAYGDSVESLSRVALLLQARSLGIGERRPRPSGLPRRPLVELAQLAAERLDVRRGTGVQRIDEEPAGGFRIATIDHAGREVEMGSDAVVVALGAAEAARVARTLLTPAERGYFDAMATRPVTTLSVALDGVGPGASRPIEVRIPRREGSAISCFVVEPGQPGGRVPEGQSQLIALARDAFSIRWREMADDVVAKNMMSSLELVLPGTGERIRNTRLGRSTAPFFEVGSYRRLATFQKVQRDRRGLGRRLYWAGDYLVGAGFEAACRSGLRAATDLASDVDADHDADAADAGLGDTDELGVGPLQ
jgi:protoporphyrinogen oxidase